MIIAFAVKAIIIVFVFSSNLWLFDGFNSLFYGGDTYSYINPIENLLNNNIYAENIYRIDTYGGRMPGIGIIYLFFRLFADQQNSMALFCLFQYMVSFLSLYFFNRVSLLHLKDKKFTSIATMLFASSTFLLPYDNVVMSESLTVSFLIIGLFFYLNSYYNSNNVSLLIGGIFMGWTVFMKPIMSIPYFIMMLYLVVYLLLKKQNIVFVFKKIMLFTGVFIISETIWIARNFQIYNRIVLLQSDVWAGYDVSTSYKALVRFCGALGYEPVFWDKTSPMSWFYEDDISNSAFEWAPVDMTSKYTLQNLMRIREEYHQIPYPSLQTASDSKHDEAVAARVNSFEDVYKKEYPLRFYVINPLKHVNTIAFKHGTTLLFNETFSNLPTFYKIIKIFYSLFHIIIVLFGLFSCIIFVKQNNIQFIIRFFPIYIIVFIAFVFKQPEFRYFSIAYPFLIITFVDFLRNISLNASRIMSFKILKK